MTSGLREILEAEAEELRIALGNWREPEGSASQKEFALILYELGLQRLREISAALRRMDDVPVFEKEKIDETASLRKRSPHAERLRGMVRGAGSSGI